MAASNVFTPSLTLGGIYDSNINFSNASTDVNGADYIALINPALFFKRETESFMLESYYTFEAKLYANNSTLNFFTHAGGLDMHDDITRKTTIGINEKLRFSQETADAFNIGVQTRRTNTLLNTATVDVLYHFTDKASSTISYTNSQTQFQDPVFFDTRTDIGATAMAYELSAVTTLTGAYHFTNFTSKTPKGNNTTATHDITLGIDTKLTSNTVLTLNGGFVYTDVINAHLNWSADAFFTIFSKYTSVRLGFSRKINNSIGLSTDIIESQVYSIETTYKLGKSNLLSLSGFLFEDKSIEGGSVDFLSYEGVITDEYQLYSWLKIVFGYTYLKQEEKADISLADSFVRNLVYLNLNFVPGGWKF